MDKRFELNLKNKEVRIWLYLMVPTIIIGSLILFNSEQEYQYIRIVVLVIALLIFLHGVIFTGNKKRKIRKMIKVPDVLMETE